MNNKQVQATQQNIDLAIDAIKNFANERGFQVLGDFNHGELKFSSKNREKVVSRYLWKISTGPSMASANRFLHFLYKKIYGFDQAPRVDFSQKELAIKAARKKWKEAARLAEELRVKYREEKGDFYKN
jgi:hypothetical protein